ncbi:MAG: hypothetical protein IM550_00245 [Microcystis sp. M54BS1]|nr:MULTISPECIES: hypothetical protein [unclassified Microcystis]MCA2537720.1 hypothetical protein [Microcystis sp. M54BS1]MCA2594626.1 hypothetical protein [Microcystis sp. M38BS1]MCA2612025.1 hypothetical protein [Microcystis sp. M27BS1]MCA2504625.1 hypothetical protein [Microcystis sp. M62BS1]MCA2509535.1 hypothetical protein [Microcystis sp. M60BS1]
MEYQQLLFNDSNNYWFKWAIFVGLNGQYLLVDILTVSDYIVDTIEENRAIVKNSTKKLVECCRTAQPELNKRSTYRFPSL